MFTVNVYYIYYVYYVYYGQQSKPLSALKKVPVIAPIPVNNKLTTNFKGKANISMICSVNYVNL